MIDVYQAEWCPFSSAVRERLNELELPFVCRPVPAERDAREEVSQLTGGDPSIPVVVLDDGTVLFGDTDDIIAELDARFPEPPGARAHQEALAAHQQ
jgi:glutaredoxin